MNFNKDVLLIDTEFSGFDLKKHEILQIAGVLLDKKTLEEKKFFNSYVKPSPSRWKTRDKESMAVNKITFDQIKNAPPLKQVIQEFDAIFGQDVVQAAYVGFNDKRFLMESYRRSGLPYNFDYHYFDLWGLFYAYLAKHNKLKNKKTFVGFEMEDLIKMFKIKVDKKNLHDALVDCRVEADVLRQVMKVL